MSTAAALHSTGGAAEASEEAWLADAVDHRLQPDGLAAVDRKLATLCRERGPLRAVLARIAYRLVVVRAWERIGHARLSDYAVERLGLSARWVRSLALVGEAFRVFPSLEDELVAGTLGWTKVRLLASLPRGEDEAGWIARARRVTAEQPPELQGCDDTDASWCPTTDRDDDAAASETFRATRATSQEYGALQELLVGLEQADAFELDDRLRRALSIEQRLDARIGPLLTLVWNRWIPRLLGYRTREDYARERLGMDPTRPGRSCASSGRPHRASPSPAPTVQGS